MQLVLINLVRDTQVRIQEPVVYFIGPISS